MFGKFGGPQPSRFLYLGAPNVENYAPPRSVILARDFANVRELAHYLRCLVVERPDLYAHWAGVQSMG